MTLSDLTLPVPYSECKHLALVYPYEVAVQWYLLQQQYGDHRHVAAGQELPDGRWVLGGHLLSEMYPGGLLGWAVGHLTPEVMQQIEVVTVTTPSGGP